MAEGTVGTLTMGADPKSMSRPTVLIVEDEDVLLELLRGMLEANGFHVLTCMDGLDAVRIYKEKGSQIDVVLTDMGLPALGGWEVLAQVRAINPGAKVVCASGFLDSSIRDEMIAAGAVDFIQKPYSYENLIGLLRSLTSR